MLKAIRSKWGRTFLDFQGNWVIDVDYARKFATVAEAVLHCEAVGLRWYEVETIVTPEVRVDTPRPILFGSPSTNGHAHN
jgi:hypothetical protein